MARLWWTTAAILALVGGCTADLTVRPDGAPPRADQGGPPRVDQGGPPDGAPPRDLPPPAPDASTAPDQRHDAPPPDSGLPLGTPISAPRRQWTWVDFPDAVCDDGSPTGLGVNPGDGSALYVFLQGGGACWDYQTCYTLNIAVHGPYGSLQFDQAKKSFAGPFDRTDAANPFKDWNQAYIPYCTGDFHGGDKVADYVSGATTKRHHHKGHANIVAFLKRLAATFPAASKVVVAGSSAGGVGALLTYDTFHRYFPRAKLYLIDDSGPLFAGNSISTAQRQAWYQNWNLGALLDGPCPKCRNDLGELYSYLGQRWATDRLALISSVMDGILRGYYSLNKTTYEAAVTYLSQTIFPTRPAWRAFLLPGVLHVFLPTWDKTTVAGVDLRTWLNKMVADDPTWSSVGP
ncbi:MAG: esterase [Deltaproteobacteria bacterium]|nr:esterase [Deltaproteobacteria bacterium]